MLNHPVINRSVLLVVPNQPFYDWSDALTPNFPTTDLNQVREYNSYLVKDGILVDELEEELQDYWERIFINELFTYSDDHSRYPELSWQLFVEWFDCYISNFANDLTDVPLYHQFFD